MNTMDSRLLSIECNKVNCHDLNETSNLLVIIFNTLEMVIVDLMSASIRYQFKVYEIYSIMSQSTSNNHSVTDKMSNMLSRESYYKKSQIFSLPLHVLKYEQKKNINLVVGSSSGSILLGDIHAVKFIDNNSMYEICDRNYSTKMVSDHRILIVCDNAIIIYDYILRTGYTIPTEMGKCTTYAEFISHNILSIGYNDGSIAFVNSSSSQSPLKMYPSYSKSMITFMRLCSYQSTVNENFPNYDKDTHSFRLLVIQQDGAAYIWEGNISNNNVDIRKNQPSVQLKDGMKSNAFFSVPVHKLSTSLLVNYSYIDESSNSLITITSDRVVRMWDLGNNDSNLPLISTKPSNKDLSSRNKRLSFFSSLLNRNINTSNVARHADDNEDARERSNSNISSNSTSSERDRSNTNTTSDLSSIITNKHIIQSLNDNSTIRRAGDNSVSDLMCYERIKYGKKDVYSKFSACAPIFSIKYPTGTHILANKANSNLLIVTNNTHENFSDRTSENNTNTVFLDPLHEINLFSLLQAYNITTASNHTIKVMLLKTIRSLPELILVCTNVGVLLLNIASSICGPFVGTHKVWGPIHLSYSNSSIQKAKITDSYLMKYEHVEGTSEFIDHGKIINSIPVDVIKELNCHVSNHSIRSSPTKFNTDLNDLSTLNHYFIINRPIVSSSPSGKFCSFYWPQSCYYIIVAVNISWNSGACMQEVERGQCAHFAWMCDISNPQLFGDIFVILTIKQNIETLNGKGKNTSILNNLFSSDTHSDRTEHIKYCSSNSVELVFKHFSGPDTNGRYGSSHQISIPNITTTISINSINHIHGGLLLSITSPISSDFNTCISKSKLMHLIRDEKGNQLLKQIGPSMAQITQVSWDYSTGYGALCIGDRINIVYLQLYQSKCTLQSLHSIGMESATTFNYRLWWDLGSLYICNGKVVYIACTQYPHASRIQSIGYVGKRDINIPVIDIFTIAHNDCLLINPAFMDNRRNFNYSYNPELQHAEIIDIRKGNLILSNTCNGTIFSLPLVENPLATLTIMLTYGNIKNVVEWSKALPLTLHNTIANLLLSRGFTTEALLLSRISKAFINETWRYRDNSNQCLFSELKSNIAKNW